MILPDFTLVLQMVHFYMAYLIMKHFVFAPALKILEVQDGYKQSLAQKIAIVQVEYTEITKKQSLLWHAKKTELYAFIPRLSRICLSCKKTTDQPLIKSLELSSNEQKALVEKLCKQLSDVVS